MSLTKPLMTQKQPHTRVSADELPLSMTSYNFRKKPWFLHCKSPYQ